MKQSLNKNIMVLRDQTHLTSLCHKANQFLVLVYADTCKPCNKLKPQLFQKTKLHDIDVYTIHVDKTNHTSLMKTLEVGKVPHVSCFHDGQYKGSIQNSDIDITWPFVEKHINMFALDVHF